MQVISKSRKKIQGEGMNNGEEELCKCGLCSLAQEDGEEFLVMSSPLLATAIIADTTQDLPDDLQAPPKEPSDLKWALTHFIVETKSILLVKVPYKYQFCPRFTRLDFMGLRNFRLL